MLQYTYSIQVLLIIAFVAVAWVISVINSILGTGRKDEGGFEIVRPSWPTGRAVLVIAEFASYIFMVAVTFVGALQGTIFSSLVQSVVAESRHQIVLSQFQAEAISAIIGAAAGFLSAALLVAPFYALFSIENNTRRSAVCLERLSHSKKNAPDLSF
ncbi:MAG TPA: hypothetical protein VMT72_19445 [Pseudolabrys sp.]|nr:hypothetical protein [Pseudolabrys sp.]